MEAGPLLQEWCHNNREEIPPITALQCCDWRDSPPLCGLLQGSGCDSLRTNDHKLPVVHQCCWFSSCWEGWKPAVRLSRWTESTFSEKDRVLQCFHVCCCHGDRLQTAAGSVLTNAEVGYPLGPARVTTCCCDMSCRSNCISWGLAVCGLAKYNLFVLLGSQ